MENNPAHYDFTMDLLAEGERFKQQEMKSMEEEIREQLAEDEKQTKEGNAEVAPKDKKPNPYAEVMAKDYQLRAPMISKELGIDLDQLDEILLYNSEFQQEVSKEVAPTPSEKTKEIMKNLNLDEDELEEMLEQVNQEAKRQSEKAREELQKNKLLSSLKQMNSGCMKTPKNRPKYDFSRLMEEMKKNENPLYSPPASSTFYSCFKDKQKKEVNSNGFDDANNETIEVESISDPDSPSITFKGPSTPKNLLSSTTSSVIPKEYKENPMAKLFQEFFRGNESSRCFCFDLPVHKKQPKPYFMKCVDQDCFNSFHVSCLRINDEAAIRVRDSFECAPCLLLKCDPLNEVLSTLIQPTYLSSTSLSSIFAFDLSEEDLKMIRESNRIGVELRCMMIDAKRSEIAWPDIAEIYLNDNVIQDIRPLSANSALKRRKDEKLFVRENLFLGSNLFKIKEIKIDSAIKTAYRIHENAHFVAAVYLVKKLTTKEAISQILSNSESYCTNSLQRIVDSMSEAEDISQETVSISLLDTMDLCMIETPVKGKFCTHFQCFSLENYVSIMTSSHHRKWKCPICGKKAIDLIIDKFQLDVLNSARLEGKEYSEIIVHKDGSFERVEKVDLKDQDDKSELSETNEQPVNIVLDEPDSTKSIANKREYPIMILEEDVSDEFSKSPKAIPAKKNIRNNNGGSNIKNLKRKSLESKMGENIFSSTVENEIKPPTLNKLIQSLSQIVKSSESSGKTTNSSEIEEAIAHSSSKLKKIKTTFYSYDEFVSKQSLTEEGNEEKENQVEFKAEKIIANSEILELICQQMEIEIE